LRHHTSNGDALRLSSRQLFGQLVADLGEAEGRERGFRLRARRLLVEPLQ
jgi:hypothetical protein